MLFIVQNYLLFYLLQKYKHCLKISYRSVSVLKLHYEILLDFLYQIKRLPGIKRHTHANMFVFITICIVFTIYNKIQITCSNPLQNL